MLIKIHRFLDIDALFGVYFLFYLLIAFYKFVFEFEKIFNLFAFKLTFN